MKQKAMLAALGLAVAVTSFCTLQAREIEMWPYDRLKSEADVVVVGLPEKSEDSGEIINAPLWQTDFVGVNTTFKITGVLKGRPHAETLVVFHLRLPEGKHLDPSPLLAAFRNEPLQVEAKKYGLTGHSKPEYLMFLRRRQDGRYEPVSGPLDAAHAIREMFLSLPPK
jgi:hypothetical protein